MKISKNLYDDLCNAIGKVLSQYNLKTIVEHRNNIKFVDNQFVAFCWSIFHASKFDYKKLYGAGLNDSHIETALKRILSDFA